MKNTEPTNSARDESRGNDEAFQNFLTLRNKILPIIGHDLRGQVGSIKMLADMILDNPSEYSREELIESIQNFAEAAGTASGLIENLTAWLMINNQNFEFNPVVQEIGPIVQDAVSMFNQMAKRKGIELTAFIPVGITARFDKDMARIILRNLLGNAIKFTSSCGQVIIRIEETKNQMVEISITDNGKGITLET
jgi:signal transduction histidine kinase